MLGGTDCEAIRSAVLAQPANTVSSLAYVVAGAWCATRVRRLPGQDRLGAGGYSALLILIGLGSVDFHGPQWPGAKALHDYPIGLLAAWAVAILAIRWRRGAPLAEGWSGRLAVASAVVWVAAAAAYALGRTGSALCRPGNLLQLHGLWHILTALGFGLLFLILFPPAAQPLGGQR